MRVTSLLARAESIHADRDAVVVVGGERLSYRELGLRVRSVAAGLSRRGVGRGDRVAVIGDAGIAYFDVYLAAAWLGAAAVPIPTRLAAAEVATILADAGPAVVIAAPDHVAALPPGVEAIVVGSPAHEELIAGPPTTTPSPARDEDIALIVYTSGTTGLPKGVCLSQHALAINALTIGISQQLRPDDVFLTMTPLYHAAAGNRVYTMLLDGQTHVVLPRFDVEAAIAAIEEHAVTTTLAVPTQLHRLLAAPDVAARTKTLRLLVYGAGPSGQKLVAAARETLDCGLYQGYGLTEACTGVTALVPADHDRAVREPALFASCGRVLPGMEVTVCGEDGAPLPVGEVGEIRVRGDKLMSGYWRLPEDSAATLRDGELLTGDLGRLDAEGYLYVVDRLKDMLISGGVNVYPSEIERVLVAYEGVDAAAVVPRSDAEWGELPVAFVEAPPQLDLEGLRRHCEQHLARFKLPREITRVERLPRTPTGKLQRRELRQRASASACGSADPQNEEGSAG